MRTSGHWTLLRGLRCERGATAVEFAILAPFLIALFFGIFELGRALWIQGILDYAVEQAARCGAINTTLCGSTSATETFAGGQATPLPYASTCPAGQVCPVFTATAAATCGYKVSATYAFDFISIGSLPLIGTVLPTSLSLSSQSCFPT